MSDATDKVVLHLPHNFYLFFRKGGINAWAEVYFFYWRT